LLHKFAQRAHPPYVDACDGGCWYLPIEKNCRTSVEMIEQYYASHIKHMIDGEAVNVCRPRSNGRHTGREISAKRSKFGQDTEIGTNADATSWQISKASL
jgi:hypothetical protein